MTTKAEATVKTKDLHSCSLWRLITDYIHCYKVRYRAIAWWRGFGLRCKDVFDNRFTSHDVPTAACIKNETGFETCIAQSCPWVGLGWVEIFLFLVGWVGSWVRNGRSQKLFLIHWIHRHWWPWVRFGCGLGWVLQSQIFTMVWLRLQGWIGHLVGWFGLCRKNWTNWQLCCSSIQEGDEKATLNN